MKTTSIFLTVTMLWWLASPLVHSQSPEAWLPDDCWLSWYFCGQNGLERSLPGSWQETNQNPELQAAKKMWQEMGQALWDKLPLDPNKKAMCKLENLLLLLEGPLAVGLRPIQKSADPQFILVFGETKHAPQQIETILTQLLGMTIQRSRLAIPTAKKAVSVEVKEFVQGRNSWCGVVWQNMYFLTNHKPSLAETLLPKKSLSQSATFQKLRTMSAPSPSLLFSWYVNLQTMWQQSALADNQQMLARLGVLDGKGAMWSLVSSTTKLHAKLALFAPGAKKGVAQLLTLPPGNPAQLAKYIPCATSRLLYLSVDLSKIFAEFKEIVRITDPKLFSDMEQSLGNWQAQIHGNLDDDFLSPLSGEILLFTPALSVPELANVQIGIAKLRNVQKLEAALERLVEAKWVTREHLEYQGKTIHYLLIPTGSLGRLPTPGYQMNPAAIVQFYLLTYFQFNPCYLIEGDTVIFSHLAQNLKDYLDYRATHLVGPPTPLASLAASSGIFAWDEGVIGPLYLYNTSLPILSFVEGVVREFGIPLDMTKFPAATTLRPLFGPTQFAYTRDRDGFLATWEFQSGNVFLNPGFFGLTGVSVAAALLLPALSSVQNKAQEVKCRANLNMIGKATRLYQQDFGRGFKFPPLKNPDFFTTLYTSKILTEREIFISPMSSREPATDDDFKANRPNVTDYEVRTVPFKSFAPNATTQYLIWTKPGIIPNGRNVLFLDMHVEFVPEAEFLEKVQACK